MCEPITLAAVASAATGLGATSAGVMGALGTTALTASLALSFQHYFEFQVEEARKISQ